MYREAASPVTEPCGLGHAELQRLSDADLMRHLAAGHDDALTILFDRYHRLVLHAALKMLHDVGEAQDVTQEIFLYLYQSVAKFDPALGTTKMWILHAAYQRILNRRGYLKRRCFDKVEEVTEDVDAQAPSCGFMPPEASRLVHQVLQRLDARQRRVVEMAYFNGLSMDEIAQKMGESVGNVRHHYYRGMAKLKILLLEQRQAGPVRAASEEAAGADS